MNILTIKWMQRHFSLASLISTWSKDPNTKVGSIIITEDGKPRSWGFNGIPSGVEDTPDRFERPTKYNFFAHAERNALDLCETSVRDCILFCTHSPCSDCARGIVSKHIKTVIVDAKNGFIGKEFIYRNDSSINCHYASLEMFTEAGVQYYEFDRIAEQLFQITKQQKGELHVRKILDR